MSNKSLSSVSKRIKREHAHSNSPLISDDTKINDSNQTNVVLNNASMCENDSKSDGDSKTNITTTKSKYCKNAKVSKENKNLPFDGKRPEREIKQHSKIPNHVIQTCVSHHLSENFSDEILQPIADYCSHKLIRILKSAISNMKFSSRSKFTTADFNKGLTINGEDVYETLPIQIRPLRKRKVTKSSKSVARNTKSDVATLSFNCLWLKNHNPFCPNLESLPNELNEYFNSVTKILCVGEEDICFKVIKNLKDNNTVLPLVPKFINFFIFNINNSCHGLRMSLFLNGLFCLLSNSYIYFDTSLTDELISTVLKILTSDVHFSDYDSLYIKDISALILSEILRRNESGKIFLGIVHDLKSVFSDFHKPFISHYGTLVALNTIGVPAIVIAILPHIKSYFRYLNAVSDLQKNCDKKMIEGQLIQSYYQLIHYYFKYEHNISPDLKVQHFLQLPYYYLEFLKDTEVFPLLSSSEFEQYFGDTLVPHFSLLNFVSCETNKKTKQRNLRKKFNILKPILNQNHANLEEIFDIIPIKNSRILFGKITL